MWRRYIPEKFQSLATKLLQPAVRSILVVTALLLFARFLGFIRQVLLYQKMDAIASDLLLSAAKIPETMATFLIMGTIISSVLPVAARIEAKSPENSQTVLSLYLVLILAVILGVILAVSAGLFVFVPEILQTVTSKDILEQYRQAGMLEDYVLVTRILLLGPSLYALQGILGVFLTMKQKFLVFASAGIFYNIGAVVTLLIFPKNSYTAVAWGMILGAASAVLAYWLVALKEGLRGWYLFWPEKFRAAWQLHRRDFWQTWKLFLPRIFLINSAVFTNLIIVYIAQNQGQITALDIALSIQAVFLVLIGAIGSVFFPDLAKVWNNPGQDSRLFWNKLFVYTEKTTLVTLVGTVFTFFTIPIIMWLFEITGKGQDNAEYITYLARVLTLGLVFQAVNEILTKYFYVRERIWQPVLVSLTGTMVQIVIILIIPHILPDAGVVASLSLIVSNLVIMLISFWLIRRDYLTTIQQGYPDHPPVETKETTTSTSKLKLLPYHKG